MVAASKDKQPIASGNLGTSALIVLLAIYPLFGLALPGLLGAGAYLLGIVLIVFWFIAGRRWRNAGLGYSGVVWMFTGIWAIATFLLNVEEPDVLGAVNVLFFTATIVLTWMLSSAYKLAPQILTLLLALLSFHAIATIGSYFIPTFGDLLNDVLHEGRNSHGYRSGMTPNPSFNALYCALGTLLVVVKLMVGTGSRAAKRLLWTLLPLFGFALLLTAKRSHALFLLITILFVSLFVKAPRLWAKVTLGMAGGVLGLLSVSEFVPGLSYSLNRFLGTFETGDLYSATSGRTFLWETALEGWGEAPIAGHGWGAFYAEWPGADTVSYIAHNQILNSLYETGLVGTALFLTAATISLLHIGLAIRRLGNLSQDRGMALVAMSSFAIQVFMLSYASTGGELLSQPYTYGPYFLAVALGFAVTNHRQDIATWPSRSALVP